MLSIALKKDSDLAKDMTTKENFKFDNCDRKIDFIFWLYRVTLHLHFLGVWSHVHLQDARIVR